MLELWKYLYRRLSHFQTDKVLVEQNFSAQLPACRWRIIDYSKHVAAMKHFFSLVFLFMIPKDYHKGLKLFPVPFDGFCYT